ncbi:MAG TPA: 50S ribosomal protein L25 [Candidatus Saccharibacteria bacterium]|nr:50S ribosomal protein L25 [Candidatus Saccharibacteria bacterium]HRQ06544.1 50S ribosomal protein L25 [Candidatus Saccharibacteria bacterium]HRQ97946.1 50S ribosomal protein L25 [Candidatus Saccharibacteria bacterium]
MVNMSLKLDGRTVSGKHVAKLRKQGIIPSVVYGGSSDPISTQSPAVETTKIAHAAGRHTPIDVVVDGKKKLAIIKSIDMDPIKHTVRHIAFHTIRQDEKIVTQVPIILTGIGESIAERAGLVVLQAIEDIEVRALPANLPESIEMSILNLATDEDKLMVKDIVLGEGVEFADHEQDLELVIANVYEPSALQAANEASGGDAEDESEVESENGEVPEGEESSEDAESGDKSEAKPKSEPETK